MRTPRLALLKRSPHLFTFAILSLSSDSSNSQPPKKSKITLHFANSTTNSPDPTVPAPLAGTTTSTKPSPSPSASALPPPVSSSSTTPLPVPSPAGPPLVVVNGGPSAAGLDKKNKRVVDPDRQCGVINERGLPCQRSLTCKTHNMTAKRAVPHRSQPFDSLLLEWQKASRLGKEREALSKGLRDGGIGGTGVGPGGLPQGVANGMQGQMQIGGVPGGDESMSGGAGGGGGPASGKKEKRKKNANNLLTANGQLPPGLDAASLLQAQANGLSGGATMSTTSTTTGKKSKKPNANSLNSTSNGSNLQSIYYVGEAPPPPPTATTGGKPNEEEEEEESDYLSSSDEVESVLLSLQKLAKNRRIQPPSTGTGGSPLLMREGSGSGFSSASWWTGRNRKLMRLRGLGLDTVFGGGSQAGTGGGLNGGNAKR